MTKGQNKNNSAKYKSGNNNKPKTTMKADRDECKICDERVEKDDKGINCDV